MSYISKKLLAKQTDEIAVKTEIQEKIQYLIDSLCTKFDKHGVKYSLDAGTLLGFYRDGKPILGDGDADVIVNIDDLNVDFLRNYSANNLNWLNRHRVEHVSVTRCTGSEMLRRKENHIVEVPTDLVFTDVDKFGRQIKFSGAKKPLYVDIFVMYDWNKLQGFETLQNADELRTKYQDYYITPFGWGTGTWEYDLTYLRIPKRIADEVSNLIGKNGTSYSVFKETEEFIVRRYGKNWNIPDPTWSVFSKKNAADDKICTNEVPFNHFKYEF